MAGISLFHKYFYTGNTVQLKTDFTGEKSRLGPCSTEAGAQTFFLGENRDISPLLSLYFASLFLFGCVEGAALF